MAAFLTPYLDRHPLAPGWCVAEAADFLARMVLSYMTAPGRWDLDDPDQVARLVRAELLGGIVPTEPLTWAIPPGGHRRVPRMARCHLSPPP